MRRTSPGYNHYITAAEAARVDDPDTCPYQPGLNECQVCGQSTMADSIEFVWVPGTGNVCESCLTKDDDWLTENLPQTNKQYPEYAAEYGLQRNEV